MSKGTIVIKNKGFTLPDDYLKSIMDTKPAYIGVAVAHENGKEIGVLRKKASLTFHVVKQMVDSQKNHQLTMFFGSLPEGLEETQGQPFTLWTNSEGKPVVVCFMDGDFSDFDKVGSTYPGEYHAVDEDIKPRIEKILSMVDGDVSKLSDEILETMNARRICNTMLGERGSIAFLCLNNIATTTIKDDPTQKEFEWGWTSNVHGFVSSEISLADELKMSTSGTSVVKEEPKKIEKTVEAVKKPLPKLSNNAPPIIVADTKPIPQPVKTETAVVVPNNPEERLSLNVPQNMDPKKRAKWFRNRNKSGMCPKDFNTLSVFTILRKDATAKFLSDYAAQMNNKKAPLKDLKEIGDALNIPKETPVETKPSEAPAKQTSVPQVSSKLRPRLGLPKEQGYPPKEDFKKDVTAHNIPVEQPEAPKPAQPVVTDPTPIASPEKMKQIKELVSSPAFKSAVDRNSQMINDPSKFSKYEQWIEDITKQMGLKDVYETKNWMKDQLTALGQNSLEFVVDLSLAWKHEAMRLVAQNIKLTSDLKAAEQLLGEISDKQIPSVKQETATSSTLEERRERLAKLDHTPEALKETSGRKRLAPKIKVA